MRVRAVTVAGRSARTPGRRFGTEITHCRTGTGGMTLQARLDAFERELRDLVRV